MSMTKMTYGLRVIDLSKKYFGDLVPEDRMGIKHKLKKDKTIKEQNKLKTDLP